MEQAGLLNPNSVILTTLQLTNEWYQQTLNIVMCLSIVNKYCTFRCQAIFKIQLTHTIFFQGFHIPLLKCIHVHFVFLFL